VLTDKKGIPLSICLLLFITAVNTHDMKAATKTIDGILAKRKRRISSQKQNLCLDKGYDFQEIEHESIKRYYYIPHIRQRGEDSSLINNNDGFHVSE
jgi:putative transposase